MSMIGHCAALESFFRFCSCPSWVGGSFVCFNRKLVQLAPSIQTSLLAVMCLVALGHLKQLHVYQCVWCVCMFAHFSGAVRVGGWLECAESKRNQCLLPFFVRRCRAPAAQWKLMLLCCLCCFSKCLNLQEALSKNPETELGWGRLFFESAAAL